MAFGMSYEEFWHGKPILAKFYRQKHLLEIEQRNQELWMQGLYIFDAVAVAINNCFSKHKMKYMNEPIRITPKTEDELRAEKEEIRKKFVERLNQFAKDFNKRQETVQNRTE